MKTSEYQPAFFNQRSGIVTFSVSLIGYTAALAPISFYRTAGYRKRQDDVTPLFWPVPWPGFYAFFHYFTPSICWPRRCLIAAAGRMRMAGRRYKAVRDRADEE